METEEQSPPYLTDTPASDRIWNGLVVWIGGIMTVCGAALAISAALGWPRRAAGALPGVELAFLAVQAGACSGFIVRTGWRLCRRLWGAVAVAFAGGVPGALAVLMTGEWWDPGMPMATWAALLAGSVRFAALEAVPVGYVLWRLAARPAEE